MRFLGVSLLVVLAAGCHSRYRDRYTDALTEEGLALVRDDLLCEGNTYSKVQPDATEAPVIQKQLKYTTKEIQRLTKDLYRPLQYQPAARVTQKAMCEYWLRHADVTWNRSVGEAVDAGVCESKLTAATIYEHPAYVLALAEQLYVGQPNEAELKEQTAFQLASTRGYQHQLLCRNDASDDDWPYYGALNSCPSRTPASCTLVPLPYESWTYRSLVDAIFLLQVVNREGPLGAQAQALQEKLTPLRDARQGPRAQKIQKMRDATPEIIPVNVVKDLHTKEGPLWRGNYLWHELCDKPRRERHQRDGVVTKSRVACVRVTSERYDGCLETEANFRLNDGEAEYRYVSTEKVVYVPCP